MADPQSDGWETVNDPSEIPADIRKSIGTAGIRKAFGIGENDKSLPESAAKRVEDQVSTYATLKAANGGFKDDFAGNTLTGDWENKIQAATGWGTPGQRDWWARFRQVDNQIRNDLFGAALTASEQAAYEATTISPSMAATEIRANLASREKIIREALSRRTKYLKANGYRPEAVDALLGEYIGDLSGNEQTKGGDQKSDTTGAASTGSDQPPPGSGGPAPQGPGPRNPGNQEVQFSDEAPQMQSGISRLTPEQNRAYYNFLLTKPSADQIREHYAQYGAGVLSAENAQQLADYYAKGGKDFGVDYSKIEVKPVDAGDGNTGAAARGAYNALTLGFGDEIGALADTVTQGGTYADNVNLRRGYELYDEENRRGSRFAGQLIGSVPLGGVEFLGARAAARAAGIDAVRAGTPVAEARVIANRVLAQRTAAEAAGVGAVYGAGDANGSAGDRLLGAGIGGAVGGVTGGALSLGGGRFARALAARRAARLRAMPAETDASRIAQMAREQNVAILPQDLGNDTVAAATQATAQTPFGGGTIRKAADNLHESFGARTKELGGAADTASDVGMTLKQRSADLAGREAQRAEETSGAVQTALGTPDDLTGAGQIAQRGVSRFIDQTAQRANELYARVPIPQEANANLGNTRAVLRDLTAGMESNPELSRLFENGRMRAYLDAVTPRVVQEDTGQFTAAGQPILRDAETGGQLSWRDLQEFRTRVGDALDDPRLSEKIAPRQLRALYGALTNDMEATASQQGEGALRAWRRANNYYDGRMKRINDTLSIVVGERKDRTPNEAIASLQSLLRSGSTDNAAAFSRVMRSIPADDARTIRATIVNDQRGGKTFDPASLAKRWDSLSERGKSALLPEAGLRSIMDDAADRAAASTRDPMASLSGEQAFLAFERLANNRGDSAAFRSRLNALSPEEANGTRALIIDRMGRASAGRQNADGDAFSIARFLTRWNEMTPQAKATLFGDGEMRSNFNALAEIAERVKKSEALRNTSNTAGALTANATSGSLLAALGATMLGHWGAGVALAAPAALQRIRAEVLTSKTFLNWLARAPKKPNIRAQQAHVQRLTAIARAEPVIANDVLALQTRLQDAFRAPAARLAADESQDHAAPVDGQGSNQQGASEGLQP